MSAPAETRPRVTIGVPLYRAERFVPRIVENVESVDDPDVEFLLADHHGLDGAVDRLRERLGPDPRVAFFVSQRELDWIGNYNFLLGRASGRYFRILSQDDRLPAGSLAAAVAFLEHHPEAVGVDGPADLIDLEGRVIRRGRRTHPGSHPAPGEGGRRRLDALGLFGGWRHPDVSLGLVRLAVARDHGLAIPYTHDETGLSMRAWAFALALRGPLCFLPGYVSQRCVHPESFTARHFRRSAKDQVLRAVSYARVAAAELRASGAGRVDRFLGVPALYACALVALPALRAFQRARGGEILRQFRGGQAV